MSVKPDDERCSSLTADLQQYNYSPDLHSTQSICSYTNENAGTE